MTGSSCVCPKVGSVHGSSQRIGLQLRQTLKYRYAATAPTASTTTTIAAIHQRRLRDRGAVAAEPRSGKFMGLPIASDMTLAYSASRVALPVNRVRSLVNP